MPESAQKKENNISVILPAYNEKGNIRVVIEKSVKALKDNRYPGEVILINDGSNDGTKEEAESIAANFNNVRVINHRKNEGLTEALLSGFKAAKGDVIVFLCADMQSDPEEDIPRLVQEILNGSDVILGWRQGRKGMRAIVSRIYHMLSKFFFGISLHDMNWIKAFRKEVVEQINLRSDWHRYIPVLAGDMGFSIKEVKTSYYPRMSGKTKYGTWRILSGALDLLTIRLELSFVKKPMHLFGSIGLLSLLSGSLLGIWIGLQFLIFGLQNPPSKGVYFLLLLLVLVGIQFFSFGFIAEFLVSIKDKISSLEERLNSKSGNK